MARASIEELQAQSEKLDRALAKRGVSDKDIIAELPDTCARLKEMGQVRLSYVDYSCDRSIVCAGSNAAYRGTPRAAKMVKYSSAPMKLNIFVLFYWCRMKFRKLLEEPPSHEGDALSMQVDFI